MIKNVHIDVILYVFFLIRHKRTKFAPNKPNQPADKMKTEGSITLLTTCWGHALNISRLFSLSFPSSIWTFDVFVPHSIPFLFFFFFTSTVGWLRNNPPLFSPFMPETLHCILTFVWRAPFFFSGEDHL